MDVCKLLMLDIEAAISELCHDDSGYTIGSLGIALDGCTIVGIIADGPAFQCRRLNLGDKIVKVNDVPVSESSIIAAIAGNEEEEALIEVQKPNGIKMKRTDGGHRQVELTRVKSLDLIALHEVLQHQRLARPNGAHERRGNNSEHDKQVEVRWLKDTVSCNGKSRSNSVESNHDADHIPYHAHHSAHVSAESATWEGKVKNWGDVSKSHAPQHSGQNGDASIYGYKYDLPERVEQLELAAKRLESAMECLKSATFHLAHDYNRATRQCNSLLTERSLILKEGEDWKSKNLSMQSELQRLTSMSVEAVYSNKNSDVICRLASQRDLLDLS
eukprot:763875-Hanusia_phi.AAC.1